MTPVFQPTGPCPARIMIVGEFPGIEEERVGMPFAGQAGRELDRMLQEAGIFRNQCFVTNVLRVRPPAGELHTVFPEKKKDIDPFQHKYLLRDRYASIEVKEGCELLRQEIEMCRPTVIIAIGNLAMWALTGKWGITSWRSSMLRVDYPLPFTAPMVIPTLTPAMLFRQWSMRPIVVHDLRRAGIMAKSGPVNPPNYRFVIRPEYSEALSILKSLQDAVAIKPVKLSVDIETRAYQIACIGIAWTKLDALCIPLMCTERTEGYWTFEEEHSLLWELYKLLTHPNAQVIGQNFLYDAQYFHRWLGYVPNLVRDTMIAQHVCFSNMPKSLDFIASMYCQHYVYWKDDGKTWDEKTGEDQLWHYNCQDAVYTYEVDSVELQNIASMQLQSPHDFQQRLFWPVLRTMNRGIRVDQERRAIMGAKLFEQISEREAWLHRALGHPLNIKSPVQMKELFYDQLGQRPIISRKTGGITCDDEALGKIADREPLLRPLVQKVQELRSLGVFLSTFIRAPLDIDGRIRCSFNIAGTETYRFSSSQNAFGSGLNLQNIPKGNIPKGGEVGSGAELPNVRDLFIPDPGRTFFDIDLSSADLRIVVWEADEPEFKAMLKEGLDPYTEIAKEFYHDPSITKKDPRRQTFKSFAHGTNYLGTPKGLAERLGLPVHQAEETQKWYFGRFPRIKHWQDDLKDQVVKRRFVQNVFGYRCYFFDRIEGTIFNQAAAWIPQSTVGCLINRGYMAIFENLPEVEVLLQVHDSLAGQFPTARGDHYIKEIVRLAEIPLPYDDPLTIPVGVKTSTKSWGDCE